MKFLKILTFLFVAIGLLISCSGQLKSFQSSSTKKIQEVPPYYGKVLNISERIGHLPIRLQEKGDASDMRSMMRVLESMMDSTGSRQQLLLQIVEEMNDFLDTLRISIRLNNLDLPIGEGPDICVCKQQSDYYDMFITNPSGLWKEEFLQVPAVGEVDYILSITLGFSDYFVGGYVLELGTGYTIPLSQYTDLDKSAQVLYVTGALLDKEGRILRAGAEGIIAQVTPIQTSLLFGGAEVVLSNEDIGKLLKDDRREDLPGQPLKWKVALQNLVAQLLQKNDLILE